MLYIDTSVLVTAWTIETRTAEIQQWFADNHAQDMVISDWTLTEFSSALSVKVRNGQLSADDRSRAMAVFGDLCASAFEIFPVLRSDFSDAARMADQFDLGLRAADALHLAIASRNGASLITLDKGLARACATIGAGHTLL